ncbi:MAG: TrkH family potassium uptake protein [Candidatus Eisenbacteria bacterium]|nr:TrkH family potassium uptake protein [Candidatus Eisenbacteria bacterium]
MAIVLLVPLGISLWEHGAWNPLTHPESASFLATILVALLLGTLLQIAGRSASEQQGTREGFAIVTLGWTSLTLVGAIPLTVYFLTHPQGGDSLPLAFSNAFFEIMSGFTTTGATILADIEALPRGLLFWRSLTHWLGGMGIITLALAIFPAMGVGGYQMFRGEVPGPTADRLRPRLAETAKVLWGVYALLSGIETVLLMLGGMNLFDALCHTFGTMATGGFSTRNASIGAYGSAYIDWIVIVFMFLAGTNFLLHYRILFRGDWGSLRRNREFHFYAGTVLVAVVLVALLLWLQGLPPAQDSYLHFRAGERQWTAHAEHVADEAGKLQSFGGLVRHAAFQVVAIVTTTGYGTADFDIWPRAIGLLLVMLMFWGGCAGSTGGGMKMIRILIVLKAAWRELARLVKPRLIAPLKIRGEPAPEKIIANVLGFFVLFVGLFVACSLIMTAIVRDLTTGVASVAATIGNIGPGLSGVGSTQNYAWIPVGGKWVLILCMLLGRLEIFTVLVVLRPSFWRR